MSRKQQLPRPGPPPGPPADDTGCGILHVDMDAFYVSVELRERPQLRGRPVIVGGTGGRGVVASASYEARAFGVHSAMPMARARRLCPQAVVLPPRHEVYARVSAEIMEIFRAVTPLVEPLALDEAFLDVSGARRLLGRPAEIGRRIRAQVAAQQGITCSVGVAATKFVAKLASTRCKPDGLLVVPTEQVVEFLHPLPVAVLWGVGERTEQRLRRLGLRTVGDLARYPVAALRRELGDALGEHLHELAWGRDRRPVTPHSPDKSIGAEETFERDIADPELIRRELLRLSERVGARLRAAGLAGRTIGVKLRTDRFRTLTRARTLDEPTDLSRVIYLTSCELYEAAGLRGVPLRLVGVRVENLTPPGRTPRQLALDEAENSWREAERAVDQVVRRFGKGMVRPASLVDRPGGRGDNCDGSDVRA
ncbi:MULTISPECIES: DNA polymerase IV [Thermomonospora]|uniref:DNA polymerase IV n=1 Tax=Thermomonospora curvata (strain ATCC 19995 / DSM 43183 / JCM 3096 / KCTC 9072 / NBRC 15933 / NCIMB 10081 / Henssen B9) TaxID=471852 RepID=D1A7W0_THECD|nr:MULTISPECIES: DNA polymerase IV [Thermomonospora]ACY98482.1 DNA-directed DNA polymerase [Thermomonospora curvata DSM 43183]PKK13628.1 MAG: DNA polymerase IV [Thermomonospora sp. CIF 1]